MRRLPTPFDGRSAEVRESSAAGGSCTTTCSCCVVTLGLTTVFQTMYFASLANVDAPTSIAQTSETPPRAPAPAPTPEATSDHAVPAQNSAAQSENLPPRLSKTALALIGLGFAPACAVFAVIVGGMFVPMLGVLGGGFGLAAFIGAWFFGYVYVHQRTGKGAGVGVGVGIAVLIAIVCVSALEAVLWFK